MGRMTDSELLEYARENFEYHNGGLIRKSGKHIGHVDGNGYSIIGIVCPISGKKYNYKTHRIIYGLHHGFIPSIIDHIDRNKLNNRIDNLRPATTSSNARNRPQYKRVLSLPRHVVMSRYGTYSVQINAHQKRHYFGSYKTVEEAEIVAKRARIELLGYDWVEENSPNN